MRLLQVSGWEGLPGIDTVVYALKLTLILAAITNSGPRVAFINEGSPTSKGSSSLMISTLGSRKYSDY